MSAPFATPTSCCGFIPRPLSLPKPRRVVRSSEFRSIYQNGSRVTSRYFVAFCCLSEPGQPGRIGFTLPRAVGKAVIRNLIRRRMREACRVLLPQLPSGWTIVFNPRRTAAGISFPDLTREVARVFAKCAQS